MGWGVKQWVGWLGSPTNLQEWVGEPGFGLPERKQKLRVLQALASRQPRHTHSWSADGETDKSKGAKQCLVGQLLELTSKGGLGNQDLGWVVGFSNQLVRVGWGTRQWVWVASAEAKAQCVAGSG